VFFWLVPFFFLFHKFFDHLKTFLQQWQGPYQHVFFEVGISSVLQYKINHFLAFVLEFDTLTKPL